MEKIKGDFQVKGKQTMTRRKMFSGTTMAISFTIALFFINKFVWSPFKSEKRFRDAQSDIDLLLRKEKAIENGPETE